MPIRFRQFQKLIEDEGDGFLFVPTIGVEFLLESLDLINEALYGIALSSVGLHLFLILL